MLSMEITKVLIVEAIRDRYALASALNNRGTRSSVWRRRRGSL
jgi:hypothetical protein